jgi:chromosome segregation ATPase
MNTEKLLKDLKQEVTALEQQAQEAERRREIAIQEANNLEDRNRKAIAAIEADAEVKRQELAKSFGKEIQTLQSEVTSLEKIKASLLSTVEGQNGKLAKLNAKVDEQTLLLSTTQKQVVFNESKVDDLESALDDGRAEVENLETHHAELTQQVTDLETKRHDLVKDITALQQQADLIHNDIASMEELHSSKQQTLQKQLAETEATLKQAFLKLRETEQQDTVMRSAWAEERLKLDKREKVVRKRENLMSDSETRLQQHEEFMKI